MSSPTRKTMKKDASPTAAKCTPTEKKCRGVAGVADDVMCAHVGTTKVTTPSNVSLPRADAFPRSTISPKKKKAADDCIVATPDKSEVGSHPDVQKNSSCKRRRLASEDDENIGDTETSTPTPISYINSPRKINYERNNDSDTDDDSDDDAADPFHEEMIQMRQNSILKKMKRLNYEDDEDQLLHTAAFAKLFEYVKDYDVVAKTSHATTVAKSEEGKIGSDSKAVKGVWLCRGSGYVKFIKCLEEGYNCGMIRMELTKNGTLELLMCHELTHEEVIPMPSKKGNKAYTWRTNDWAYQNMTRTFAIRFYDDMDALKWKTQLESSKINNRRVRRGLDIPDLSKLDDVCSNFQNLSSTLSSSSD